MIRLGWPLFLGVVGDIKSAAVSSASRGTGLLTAGSDHFDISTRSNALYDRCAAETGVLGAAQ